MKKFIIITLAVFAVFFIVSCGDDSSSTDNNNWENQDNEIADEDSGDTGNTGNTGDTGNTGNTGNTGGDTGDTSDTGNTGNTGDEDVTDIDEMPDEDTAVDPLLEQFVGTWAQKIILKSVSSTTLAKNVPSVTTRYILADISVNKRGNLKMERRDGVMCQTDNETGNSALNKGVVSFNEPDSKFNTIYHFWRPNDIPGQKEVPQIEVKEENGKVIFTGNKEWELRGANMTDPSTETMIESDDDSRIFDHDADGKAAFTIKFSGFVNGDIYYVQRLTAIYNGELVSEGKIEGTVEWTDEQYAHSSTPNITLKGQKTTDTETENSVFQFVKVADTMTCAELIAQKDTLFDLYNPNTNPDGDPNN